MRKIAVVSNGVNTASVIKSQLETLLAGRVVIDALSIAHGLRDLIDADLVIVSTPAIIGFIGRFLREDTIVLTMKRTIAKASWGRVMEIPQGTRVLVVNDLPESTAETMALIHELGANHLELVPYHPGTALPADLPSVAVTPNEVDLVPPGVATVVNVGERVLDGYTVIDILTKLDLVDGPTIRQVMAFIEASIPISPELFRTLYGVMEHKHHLELILEVIGEGIVAYDDLGNVLIVNELAEKVLRTKLWKTKGQPLESLLPAGMAAMTGEEPMDDLSCRIDGCTYILSKYPLFHEGRFMGGVIRLREYTEIERLEQKVRREASRHGFTAKHTFDSIIGSAPSILAVKRQAERMARGGASILIEGESGSGKELFAQAIHNASPRKDSPFVAFNCAAVPDTLIESELFGYEEGAFTGARRGGRPGLFELAHKGTIFLDEIGDISPALQAKLLRALQEKEIARVGSNQVKTVDIRILTASNRRLEDLVSSGLFRKDLYYRINALVLRIPGLAERREDILPLLRYFLRLSGSGLSLSAEAETALRAYHWPGNVRELRNCAIHLATMADGPVADVADLPVTVLLPPPLAGPVDTLRGLDLRILQTVATAEEQGRAVGRATIARHLSAGGLDVSEASVRSRLRAMSQGGMLVSGRGRGGVRLTAKGTRVLSDHHR